MKNPWKIGDKVTNGHWQRPHGKVIGKLGSWVWVAVMFNGKVEPLTFKADDLRAVDE